MATPRQRLIVCLDGTWNNRNDGTNVVHVHDLIREGPVPTADGRGTIVQVKYYDPGVGTGVLDRISGGGFGFGLEGNVRDAYDWLAARYHDGDEIFIFGFSRGAFTARSLVGFIGCCGLLRRGAPLAVNELWQAYCVIGRLREQRATFMERIFGAEEVAVREITQLKSDPWDNPPSAPRATDLNETEELLVQWSRRAKITFLGVYDTVGSMGIDALAIPLLKSRLALHHNMRPTTLIQRCRHALALDEHRSNFEHTPFVAYSGHGRSRAHQGQNPTPAELEAYWGRVDADWRARVEQRWFVGAHANIGGGYASNRLGERPLEWMLEGAKAAGLDCEPHAITTTTRPLPPPRDSYREFAAPLWASILRAKRSYRRISPPDFAKASVRTRLIGNKPAPGFSLSHINEQVDPTVWQYYGDTAPPNLAEYVARVRPSGAPGYTREPRHNWVGHDFNAHAAVAFLGFFAAAGVLGALRLFFPGLGTSVELTAYWMAAAAVLYVGTDWAESRLSFKLALDGGRPTTRAFRDSIYWTRSLGVVLSLGGFAYLLGRMWGEGVNVVARGGMNGIARAFLDTWWPAAAAAAAATLVAMLINGGHTLNRRSALGAIGGVVMALVVPLLAMGAAFYVSRLLAPVVSLRDFHLLPGSAPGAAFAGTLLLLQISFVYFLSAFNWCGEPMARANLGSIVPLQLSFTPARARAQLERWRERLACPWRDRRDPGNDAGVQMRRNVAEAIARDAIGFIPVYFAVLLFGLWFSADSAHGLGWQWLQREFFGCALWLAIPLVALVTDYFETGCHAAFLWLHRTDRFGAWWAWLLSLLGGLATLAKFATFLTAAGVVFIAVGAATLRLIGGGIDGGWRSIPVLLISAAGALVMAAFVIGVVLARMTKHAPRRRHA